MTLFDPLLFLACSTLLVAVSLTALVVAAFPAIQDVSRAARSAEKLFDRLDRELSPTLEAVRLAGLELSDLSDEMSQGVQSATAVVQQVDLGLTEVKKQAGNVRLNTRSVWVGVKAAWQTWRDRGESTPSRQISAPTPTSLPSSSALAPLARQPSQQNLEFDRAQGSILEDEDS